VGLRIRRHRKVQPLRMPCRTSPRANGPVCHPTAPASANRRSPRLWTGADRPDLRA
jgi:hypothetical protein